MTSHPTAPAATAWSGAWVGEHGGVELLADAEVPVTELVGLALRRNPRRFQLIVSRVLAKHVPVAPSVARRHADRLGDLVTEALDGRPAGLVLGYAETATGLGHLVADRLGCRVLHSTRRPGGSALSFEEEHSHATTHRVQPAEPGWLLDPGAVVLVDDELTTGRTLLNTVRELHALRAHPAYVVAVLADLRPDAERARVAEVATELDASIRVVSLMSGEVRLGTPDAAVAAALAAELPAPPPATAEELPASDTCPNS